MNYRTFAIYVGLVVLRSAVPFVVLIVLGTRDGGSSWMIVAAIAILLLTVVQIVSRWKVMNAIATAPPQPKPEWSPVEATPEGVANSPFTSSPSARVPLDAMPPVSDRHWAVGMVVAGVFSLVFPFLLAPTSHWFTEFPLQYFAFALGFFALVVVLAQLGRRSVRRRFGAIRRLGWRPGSGDLWQRIDAMPVNSGTMMSTGSMHGMWRGRRAESTTLSPVGLTGIGAPFISRVDVMELPGWLPRVEIARHGINRLAAVGHVDELDVESPAFNDNFRVVSPNLPFAHAILSPRVMERLLEPDARNLALTICGDRIMVWASPPASPDGLEARLNVMADVADLIPEFVYDKWRSDGSAEALPMRQSISEKNWLGWVAVALCFTLVAPLAIPFGHLALRAAQRGKATNRGPALFALIMGYSMAVIFAIAAYMTAAAS